MAINQEKLDQFMGKVVGDLGAAASAAMVLVGDALGLYRSLAHSGPSTPTDLAKRTKTSERYIREWLANQAAGGYLEYDAKNQTYSLLPEQALALADESSPAFCLGGFQIIAAMFQAEPKMRKNFQTGEGMHWGDHHEHLFEGTERFFRSTYIGNLLSNWIPALSGVEAKLKKGAKVADVGCGIGASTIIMAQAFPKSEFHGFDYHEHSINNARHRAIDAKVADRIKFHVAESTEFPGENYDLVCHFDCLHDMGNPVAAGKRVYETLAPDGTWMIVEPFANDKVEENLNPVGRLFYAASTSICVPTSLAQDGMAIGAQAGEARLRKIIQEAGFKKIKLATKTPFNLVIEAKK